MDRIGPENVMVLLGTPTPESTRLYAMTVDQGDPSWAGALAGSALGLPAYHIIEQEIKDQIDPSTYEAEVGLAEIVLDSDEIVKALSEVRRK